MVQSYLTSEFSYQELALQVGINNPTMIARWVNEFKIAGPDALRPHRKGRKRTLSKSRTSKPDTQEQKPVVDTSVEHVQELEDENLKLRIENAFLKELRRLRLEDEAKTRGLQNHLQSPRIIQIKRSSLLYADTQGNLYVLAETI